MSPAESKTIQKVAVVGPSGTLGPPVIKHLQASGFQITLLTRDPAKLTFPPEIAVVKADYTSAASLAPSLTGHDMVIDLTNRTATAIQLLVIDATILARVPHLIPSCFGTGALTPRIRALPHVAGKAQMEDYVVKKADEGKLTFTGIQTGGFLELAFKAGWFINTRDQGPTAIFDGGDRVISMTAVDSIGRAVAAALEKAEEVKNRFLYVHNVAVTQNQMLEFARELRPGRKWEAVNKDTKEMEKASWDAWNKGDRSRLSEVGFFVSGSFGEDKRGHFQEVDNEVLGIEMFSDEELKAFLARYI